MLNTLLLSKVIKITIKNNVNCIKLNYKGTKRYYEWIGGKTIVVQVGDQIDRCRPTIYNTCEKSDATYEDEASDIEILLFFTNLHEIAKQYGGGVYSLLGNHELMNCYGDVRYVSYKNLEQVKTSNINLKKGRVRIFKRGDILSTFLACTRSSILIINNYLFVHGGLLGCIVHKLGNYQNYNIFEMINDVIKNWLMYKDHELQNILSNKYKENILFNKIFLNGNINKFIFNTDSPFYTRKLGNIKPGIDISDPICKDVHILVEYFKLKGIIVGHTPQLSSGINGTCNDKLFRIDTASSNAFYYMIQKLLEPQVLEITSSEKIRILKLFIV